MAQHPLQRLSSPSRAFSLALHCLGIASFCYNFHFLTIWKTPVDDAYGWHFQFLTILSLIASFVVFALGALADITSSSILFSLKNGLSVVATPLECLVTMLYFGISAIDPTLVVPPDFTIPLVADLGFHFAPALFLTLDAMLLSPPWTISTRGILVLSTMVGLAYWYWVEHCFIHNGYYVYPLLDVLTTPQRVLLFAGSSVWVTVSFMGLRGLYGILNGYNMPASQTPKKAKSS